MSYGTGPKIITDGLLLHLDAANPRSYAGTGNLWIDLSNNSNDATLQNTPSYDPSNKGSIAFDGVNEYVTTPLYLNQNSYTKCAWFKVNNTGYSNNIISGGSFSQHALWLGGTSKLSAGHNGNWYTVQSTTNISTGTWYFGAVTFSTTTGWKLYLNGVLESTSANTTTFSTNTQTIQIGSWDAGNFIIGNVATALVYNKVLNGTEIKKNYNASKGRYNIFI